MKNPMLGDFKSQALRKNKILLETRGMVKG
jgi:hypothetical protein